MLIATPTATDLFKTAINRQDRLREVRFGETAWRAFTVAGPMVWNSLPDNLWDPDVTIDNINRL